MNMCRNHEDPEVCSSFNLLALDTCISVGTSAAKRPENVLTGDNHPTWSRASSPVRKAVVTQTRLICEQCVFLHAYLPGVEEFLPPVFKNVLFVLQEAHP